MRSNESSRMAASDVAFAYSATTLLLTALWVALLRHKSFSFLSYAMYFPTIVFIPFGLYTSDFSAFLRTMFIPTSSTVYGLVVATIYVVVLVFTCAFLSVIVGWGRLVFDSKTLGTSSQAVHAHNRNLLLGFLRALGEEIGWRGYLLPLLMSTYSPFVALLYSGVVWFLFHVPVMVLMTRTLAVPNAAVVCLVQGASCALAAFSFGYVGVVSGYGAWAPAFAHFLFTRLNPTVLGSVYTQTSGMIVGPVWKVNGEGLMGCIVGALLAVWVVFNVN